ncbi:MAG: HEAT repeat domain-containing protein [Ktedonobacterales bacterium]
MGASPLSGAAPLLLGVLAASMAVIVGLLLLVAGHKVYAARRAMFVARIRHRYTGAIVALLADDADEPARQTFLRELPVTSLEREVVADLLLDAVVQVRGTAREGLTHLFTEAGFTDMYMRRLSQRGARTRIRAAQALGEISARDALPTLVRLLDDRSRDSRLVACRALGVLGLPEATSPLLAAYARGNLPSGVVAAAILRIGVAAGPALQLRLRDDCVPVRRLAAELVGLLGWLPAAGDVAALLSDADDAVRLRAVRSLGRLGATDVTARVADLLRDTHVTVRVGAALALGQIGDPDAAPSLGGALADADHEVRVAAADALAALGDAGMRELDYVLQNGQPVARAHAVEALQRCGYAGRMAQTWRTARSSQERAAARTFLRALAAAGGTATLEEAGISLNMPARANRPHRKSNRPARRPAKAAERADAHGALVGAGHVAAH